MKFPKHKKNFSAFSLIELVIVVAIIGVIAAISFVNLSNTKRQAAVTNTCNELASFYNKARNYALTGKIVSGLTPTFFKLVIPNTNNRAEIHRSFNSDGSANGSYSAITGDQLQFKNGVTCRPYNNLTGSMIYGHTQGYYFQVPSGNAFKISADSPNIVCVHSGNFPRTVNINGFKAECQ